jgi:hypothetical protein
MSPANELRGTATGVGVGVGVVVGVGVGVAVGVGTGGMVVEVTCKISESGVGERVCARVPVKAPQRIKSATTAAPGRDRRKACFTNNPPN